MSDPREGYRDWFTQDHTDERMLDGDQRYEHDRLRFVLRALRIPEQMAALQRMADTRGSMLATFHDFGALFPSFPFRLGCTRLRCFDLGNGVVTPANYAVHRDNRSVEPARFSAFHRVPFVVAYRRLLAEEPSDGENRGRVAMVFRRRGFRQGMVIHNDAEETYWRKGLCWVYKGEKGGLEYRYFIQSFQSLIEAISVSGWKPDTAKEKPNE
jgi:hypothetical protein